MKRISNHKLVVSALIVTLLTAFLLLYPAFSTSEAWAQQINQGNPSTLNYFFDITQYGSDGNGNNCNNVPTFYIVSTVICEFILILNEVLSGVPGSNDIGIYNYLVSVMTPVVQAMLTLYIVVFGAQLLMGTAQLQARDILARLFKIAAVWVFATNVNYGVGVAFSFYMGFIADAGQTLINSMGAFDNVCDVTFPTIAAGSNPSNTLPLFTFFDELIYCAFSGPASATSIKVAGFFMALALVYPPMFGIFTWWVTFTAYALARTVLSFLTSLTAIAFLISLGPIFLCLMLFQITNQFFESWLKYLIAYSVQIVLVFGITVMWIIMLVQCISFFSDLGNMIFPFEPGQYAGGYLNKANTWAICQPDWNTSNPVTCLNPNNPQYIPPSQVIAKLDVVDYIFTNLVTLLTLSYAFTTLLKNANDVAGQIVGGAGAPLPQGGFGFKGAGQMASMFRPQAASTGDGKG